MDVARYIRTRKTLTMKSSDLHYESVFGKERTIVSFSRLVNRRYGYSDHLQDLPRILHLRN